MTPKGKEKEKKNFVEKKKKTPKKQNYGGGELCYEKYIRGQTAKIRLSFE